jgi:hypothetical protein
MPGARKGYLDCGSNINLIRQDMYDQDAAHFGPKARLCNIKEFSIELADGGHLNIVSKLLKDATVCIGYAKYELDLFVTPNLGVGYLFGNSFITVWNVIMKPHLSLATFGIEKEMYLPHVNGDNPEYQKCQDVQVFFDIRRVPITLRTEVAHVRG